MYKDRFRHAAVVIAGSALLAGCAAPRLVATPAPAPTAAPVVEATVAATVAPTPQPLSKNAAVFATGLIYPRGLEFGSDGNLYVAEAGMGGETESKGTCKDYTSPFVPYHPAMNARVSKIDPQGVRTTVADEMPASRDQYGDVVGATDVTFMDGVLYVLNSGGGCSRGLEQTPTGIMKVNPDGSWSYVADFSAYLSVNDAAAPKDDDWEPDGSVWNIVPVDGKFYVVDTNHGELAVATQDGKITRVADLTKEFGQLNPTALAQRDGAFYISNLNAFPIQKGASKLLKVTPEGEVEVLMEGLTAVLSLAFDEKGQLYALETAVVDNDLPQPGSGRVVRITPDNKLEAVATGLSFPTGMAFGPDGMLYVSHYGYGGDPAKGEILRIDVSQPLAGMR
jgi:hypothetical protein